MPHFFRSWLNDDFRKLFLNARLWTGGFKIPENGVDSSLPDIKTFNPNGVD